MFNVLNGHTIGGLTVSIIQALKSFQIRSINRVFLSFPSFEKCEHKIFLSDEHFFFKFNISLSWSFIWAIKLVWGSFFLTFLFLYAHFFFLLQLVFQVLRKNKTFTVPALYISVGNPKQLWKGKQKRPQFANLKSPIRL